MICPKCHTRYNENGFSSCPFCGDKESSTEKKQAPKILIYGIIIFLWIGIIAIIFICTNEELFFELEDEKSTNTENVYIPTTPEIIPSKVTSQTTSLSQTKIIYNKQYYKQSITSEEDVYKLIVADSNAQKKDCPSEIIQIENDITSNYGIKAANLCEMDVDFAKELKSVINYIYNKYPQARNYLTNITLANVGDDGDFMAAFMPIFTFAQSDTRNGYPVGIKTQILLNAKYFLNVQKIDKAVSYSTNVGYFPANATKSSTVAHEFGHYLSYIALLNHYNQSKMNFVRTADADMLYKISEDFNNGDFAYYILNQAYRKYVEKYSSISFNDFREMISKYAIAKDTSGNYIYDETIAEAFHDCYLNKDNASIPSKLIVEVLVSYL